MNEELFNKENETVVAWKLHPTLHSAVSHMPCIFAISHKQGNIQLEEFRGSSYKITYGLEEVKERVAWLTEFVLNNNENKWEVKSGIW